MVHWQLQNYIKKMKNYISIDDNFTPYWVTPEKSKFIPTIKESSLPKTTTLGNEFRPAKRKINKI